MSWQETLRTYWWGILYRVEYYLPAILCGAIPALALSMCLLPWRRGRLKGKGLQSPPVREIALAILWMFSGGMVVLTLMPRWFASSLWDVLHGYPWNVADYPFFELGTVNLTPFRTLAPDFDSLFIFAGNIAMFVPFGFLAALLWRGWSWKRALPAGLAITLFVECCQLFVGRAFDVDDLMLNTLGVLCGYWLWKLLDKLFPRFCARFHVKPLKEETL